MCVITVYGMQCLFAGCRTSGAGQKAMRPECGMLHMCKIPHSGRLAGCPASDLRQPATTALHTTGGNNTHIFSSS